jgi:hypothetical protein
MANIESSQSVEHIDKVTHNGYRAVIRETLIGPLLLVRGHLVGILQRKGMSCIGNYFNKTLRYHQSRPLIACALHSPLYLRHSCLS